MPKIKSDERQAKPREQFAARREAEGFTQASLAEAVGVAESTAARWEQGVSKPRPWQRPKLAAALRVTLDGLDILLDPPAGPETDVGGIDLSHSRQRGTEQLFFGDGPVTIALPMRNVADRPFPVISSEDALAAHRLAELLDALAIESGEFRIPPHGIWDAPLGDLVAICGPKSSAVMAEAMRTDPLLAFEPDDDGRWIIRKRDSPVEYFGSPMDTGLGPPWSDVAYLGRIMVRDRPTLVIAGIHALGSVGAVDFLAHNLTDLNRRIGSRRFSMVVRSEHDGEAVIMSESLCPPRIHP